MAKKGLAVQLQAEVSSDEEWDKLLQKDGLIVVDVFSDWCGPCQGMAANLKKLKLEIGGDMLQLAIAKNDNISALERFRGKSEPTWMFISHGKMVNLMFGADAPKLTRLIVDELRVEQQAASGDRVRDRLLEVTERSPEEQTRFERVEGARIAAERKEEARKAKEFHERKVAECENILENLAGYGVILVFPCAKDAYQEVLNELINEAGLAVNQTEKVTVTEENLRELLYFGDDEDAFDEDSVEELLGGVSRWLLIKNRRNVEDFFETILRIVYGDEMRAPGAPDSSYQLLAKTYEDEETHESKQVMGVWAPPNEMVVATALRLFFPRLTKPYDLPEPEPESPYMTLVFDGSKLHSIAPLMNQYKREVMHYGFFTSEVPEEAKLVAKSLKRLEEMPERSLDDEKLVIQLSKKSSECMLAFVQSEPIYVSPNPVEGARECEIFFPEDYAESLVSEDLEYLGEVEAEEATEHQEAEEDLGSFVEGEGADGGGSEPEDEEEPEEKEEEDELEEDDDDDDDDLFGFGFPGPAAGPTTAEPTEPAT